MDNQIINLAIRNDFYTPIIFYHLKGCIYPPFLKEAYKTSNATCQAKKKLIKMGMEMMFSQTTAPDRYNLKWFVIYNEISKPVGFWGVSYPKGENNGKCLLEYLLVDECERRKGYSKKLMNSFFEWTERNGRTNIKVEFNNTDFLKKFYGNYGFALREGDSEGEGLIAWYKIPRS